MTPPATAAPDRRDAFLAAVGTADLLTPAQLTRAAEVVAAVPPTARDAARALVAAGQLTRFQAERLLAGRTDGFHLGPYVVLEQVGQGAKGRVYKARHRTTNRLVAVKVLSPDAARTPADRAEFQAGVRTTARLGHPNVVTAYDVNELGGRLYVAMEFVDGPNLAAVVKERGALPPAEACELVRQAAAGLDHAHAEGVTHLALKPENVLVARPSTAAPDPLVKVADFGFGRSGASPSLSQTPPPGGWSAGADYLAPEQANTPPAAGFQSDLYSLGAILYFLLAGRPPFPGGTVEEKTRRHLWEEPARLELLRPAVPAGLAALVHQMLAKNPSHRPRSAAEVAGRLAAFTAGYAGAVCYDLPPQYGQYSFATGQLSGGFPDSGVYAVPRSGVHPTPAPVPPPAAAPPPAPSPWAQLATEAPEAGEYKSARQPRHKGGLSGVTMGALAAGVVALCMAATGVLIKVFGK